MKFEIGKTYQHSTGKKLKILCLAETYMWGDTLIAEDLEDSELVAVGRDESSAVNFKEIKNQEKEIETKSNSSFQFLADKEEDVYTNKDGEPIKKDK